MLSAHAHFFFNLDKFNELPRLYASVLHMAAQATCLWSMSKYDAVNPAALKRLVAGGVQLRPYSQAIMEACYRAASELYAETSAKNPQFKKIFDAMVALRSDQYLWWQVAEHSYDTFMIRTRPRA